MDGFAVSPPTGFSVFSTLLGMTSRSSSLRGGDIHGARGTFTWWTSLRVPPHQAGEPGGRVKGGTLKWQGNGTCLPETERRTPIVLPLIVIVALAADPVPAASPTPANTIVYQPPLGFRELPAVWRICEAVRERDPCRRSGATSVWRVVQLL